MGTLVGLSGLAGNGKSTVAGILRGHGYREYAFADALKELAEEINPLVAGTDWMLADLVEAIGWDAAKAVPSVRAFLVTLGNAVRAIDPQHWTRSIEGYVTTQLKAGRNVVVSDMRFPNEEKFLQVLAGEVGVPFRSVHVYREAGSSVSIYDLSESEKFAYQRTVRYDGHLRFGDDLSRYDFIVVDNSKDMGSLEFRMRHLVDEWAKTKREEKVDA